MKLDSQLYLVCLYCYSIFCMYIDKRNCALEITFSETVKLWVGNHIFG